MEDIKCTDFLLKLSYEILTIQQTMLYSLFQK